MDPRIVDRLRCPVCGEPLVEQTAGTARALRCLRRHSFDVARQGYVNLLAGRAPHVGDTAEMVAARADFLAAGHYDVISSALAAAAVGAVDRWRAAGPGTLSPPRRDPSGGDPSGTARTEQPEVGAYPLVVDAGAGTGRHLAAVLAALPDAAGLALDVAKPALRRAARAHSRAAAALADTWQRLPLADDCTAVLLNVFAPRNGAEFHRVLDPAGTLLVVTPAEDHLAELVGALDLLRVDPAKADRVSDSLGGHFTEAAAEVHRRELALTGPEVATLVGMGPSAWHTDPAGLAARIAVLGEPVRVTVAVRLGTWRPR
ncbi:putative RNA methyltransferase [Micromonospora endolithica]|uniref:23S rRNA methyltransferase n=1 Tax=Micromonospora endolithica TaxID=230091 RepID=A0A3A9Z5F9_9ACTN|nr:23S rRNA methyltransferase [Micromonospora endolithica]RKN43503.1 23S rRNA methyltransferase [Micromonospora endolithica]TWJ24089.1 23S rRNA m(1)G-748 methyltransferase [Micromonospora endolithica]